MNKEEILTALLVGGLVGIFLFVAIQVRIRRWSPRKPESDDRYRSTQEPTRPTSPLRSAGKAVDTAERLYDLAFSILVVAMVIYGAVVAPRLRPILLVA